jgi:hypothetical protein
MKTLFTLAYPVISIQDNQWIEVFRSEHDPQSGLVEAHFTLVYGCKTLDPASYAAHIESVGRDMAPIRFVCRYAMLGSERDRAPIFLVPDEGFGELSRLHDALYTGPLADHLRLDIPFVPHITIGASNDRQVAKNLCDRLNARGLAIEGTVDSLTVASLESHKVRTLKSFDLRNRQRTT